MRLVLKVVAAIIAAACILNGLAAAGHAATDEARLGWFLPIARAAWPGSPCAGREVVHLHTNLDAQATTLGVVLPGGSYLLGLAEPATCEVWLRDDLDPEPFCTVLTHELGHLAGWAHTSVPGNIMNGDGDIYWAPCNLAVSAAQARGRSRQATPRLARRLPPRFRPDPAPR